MIDSIGNNCILLLRLMHCLFTYEKNAAEIGMEKKTLNETKCDFRLSEFRPVIYSFYSHNNFATVKFQIITFFSKSFESVYFSVSIQFNAFDSCQKMAFKLNTLTKLCLFTQKITQFVVILFSIKYS